MPLAEKSMNPMLYWGVEAKGFMYGSKMIFDPNVDLPLLAVIDSGTTLCIIPYKVFDGLMMHIAQ